MRLNHTLAHRISTALATLALAAGLSACGSAEFSYDSNSYFPEDWKTSYTKVSDCKKSTQHGGDYVQVWASADSKDSFGGSGTAVPTGGVIIKPQFSDSGCSELTSVTVMRKAADANTWDWQRAGDDGTAENLGNTPGQCVNCHMGCGDDLRCTK